MTLLIISNCKTCGKEFSYLNSRGKKRIYCVSKCKPSSKRPTNKCSIKSCQTVARSNAKGAYCEKHYYRIRRNGSLKIDKTRKRTKTSHGYITTSVDKEHAFYKATGVTANYEHRIVFFNHNGVGPYECNWCKIPVAWSNMHIDHINEVKDDNRPENLCASCPCCNQQRNAGKNKKRTQEAVGVFYKKGDDRLCISQWSRRLNISRYKFVNYVKNGTLKGFMKDQ